MAETGIPYATSQSIRRSFSKSFLHVWTPLTEGPPEVDEAARRDMLAAISKVVADESLDGYMVHWAPER
jgi:hypothetical protein